MGCGTCQHLQIRRTAENTVKAYCKINEKSCMDVKVCTRRGRLPVRTVDNEAEIEYNLILEGEK